MTKNDEEEDRNLSKWLLVCLGWVVGSFIIYFFCRNVIPGWVLALTIVGYLVCMYISGLGSDFVLSFLFVRDPRAYVFFLEGLLAPLYIVGMIVTILILIGWVLWMLIFGDDDPDPDDW